MAEPGRIRPRGLALIPPPLVFAATLFTGLLLDRRVPFVEPSASRGWSWLGVVLIVAGAAHALSSVALFALNRTTIIPHRRSSTFIVGGAFQWTRNPMYVGLTLIYVGIAVMTRAVWPLLLLPLPILVMDRAVIPMEERQLHETFGDAYVAYKARVRRWL